MAFKNVYEGFVGNNNSVISSGNSIEHFKQNASLFFDVPIENIKNVYKVMILNNRAMVGYCADIPMEKQQMPYSFRKENCYKR